MAFWRRRAAPTRQQLIDHKHSLEGEIRMLAAEVRRLRGRGVDVRSQEAQLARLRGEHLETRLAIDRAPRD